MTPQIDLNCDMGESFGAYFIGDDFAMMDYATSINVACGFHAGDPGVMKRTVEYAVQKQVAIGAHPGYPDLQGFGRRDMNLTPDEIYDLVVYQVGALSAFTKVCEAKLQHVKPHGALYNAAAKNQRIAEAIACAVRDVDNTLFLTGLSGSVLITEGKKAGLKTLSEVFADRTYQDDGSLTPRSMKGALIYEPSKAAEQVLDMVMKNQVQTLNGNTIKVQADTICLHGDGKHALEFAKAIVNLLKAHHVDIQKP